MKLPGARSIRARLNFIVAATTFIALLIAGLALVVFDLRSRLHAIEDDLLTQSDMLALVSSAALSFDDAKVGRENLAVLQAKPNVAAAALYTVNGRLFASFQRDGTDPQPLPTALEDSGVSLDGAWVRVWRPVSAGSQRAGSLFVLARHDLASRALEYLGVLVIVLTSSMAAALLLTNRLQRAVTQPILDISDVARRIQAGPNFDLRARKESTDEVGALADVFNAMLDELSRRARTLEEANEALRRSEDRYQLAVRGSSAGLWDWDIAQGTMFYSPRFKSALGYSAQEFPDDPSSLFGLMHPDDEGAVRQALRNHLGQDVPYQAEARIRLKSGEWRWFLISGTSRRDANGRAFRMAGSLVDVTERKRAEQVLQEANRAKDEFIATLAHELRNPLAPIRTGLDILAHDKQSGAASKQAREIMARQLSHMIRLIDDLLDISRINSGKIRLEIKRMRLSTAIESAVEIARPSIADRNHKLDLDIRGREIELMGDVTRLAQAIGNLLNNAAKYTPPGGHIALKAWQEQGTAVVEVSDDGVGIPQEMLEGVFTLFTQVGRTLDRSQGGLGIGLYLVRSLVEMHGGTVTAASGGPGRGSRFTVRIPCLLQAAADPTVTGSAPAHSAGDAIKVLVVDDNVDAADTLATVLEMTGRTTRSVFDGPSVLPAAREFGPDVILLDLGLPGMTGLEVARQLRADPAFGRTVLVAVTGWGGEQDRRRSSEAGFDAHLTKPVELADLEPVLARAAAQAAGDS